ncbi:hypothetical protein VTK56DRAFT_5939 [Thermocarpiscus australiensis]
MDGLWRLALRFVALDLDSALLIKHCLVFSIVAKSQHRHSYYRSVYSDLPISASSFRQISRNIEKTLRAALANAKSKTAIPPGITLSILLLVGGLCPYLSIDYKLRP